MGKIKYYTVKAPIFELRDYYPNEYDIIQNQLEKNGYPFDLQQIAINGDIFYSDENYAYPDLMRLVSTSTCPCPPGTLIQLPFCISLSYTMNIIMEDGKFTKFLPIKNSK